MTNEQRLFIESIGKSAKKYAKNYDIHCISVVIAQAILESGWGKSTLASKYHNYFGLKCGSSWNGPSVNMNTKEEYKPGVHTDIKANFRVYTSLDKGVKGYFEFINKPRYKNLKGVKNYKTYIKLIKQDGYATSSTYIEKLTKLVEKYGLDIWDIVISKKEYFKVPINVDGSLYKGNSIVNALNRMGYSYSFAYRTKIANANGIKNYVGSASQNLHMLDLMRKGMLVKP